MEEKITGSPSNKLPNNLPVLPATGRPLQSHPALNVSDLPRTVKTPVSGFHLSFPFHLHHSFLDFPPSPQSSGPGSGLCWGNLIPLHQDTNHIPMAGIVIGDRKKLSRETLNSTIFSLSDRA